MEDTAVISGPDHADLFGGDGKYLCDFLFLRLVKGEDPVKLGNLPQNILSLPGVLVQLPQIGAVGNRIDPALRTEFPDKRCQIIQMMTEDHIGSEFPDGMPDLFSECLSELRGHLCGHIPVACARIGHLIGHSQDRIGQGFRAVMHGIAGDTFRQDRYILRTHAGDDGLLVPVCGKSSYQLG